MKLENLYAESFHVTRNSRMSEYRQMFCYEDGGPFMECSLSKQLMIMLTIHNNNVKTGSILV